MNKTLQKLIEEAAKKYAKQFEQVGYDDDQIDTIEEAVIYGATFALQNQWISVEEALPVLVDKKSGQSEVVFAMVNYDNVFVAYYNYSNKHWYYNNYNGYDPQIYYDVTHWLPIPSLEGDEE